MSDTSYPTPFTRPPTKPSARHIKPPTVARSAQGRTVAPTASIVSSMLLDEWRGSITNFQGFNATRPLHEHLNQTWTQLQEAVCPGEPTVVTEKKDAPYFLPCLLREAPLTGKTLERAQQNGEPTVGKMRSKEHVTESNVLIYDFDGIDKPDFDRILGLLKDRGLTYVAYTTHSHGDQAKPGMRVRLCIPVDRPLDVDAYSTAWHGLATFLTEMFEGEGTQSDQGEA